MTSAGRFLWSILVLGLFAWPASLAAQEDGALDAKKPLTYRRIFVPEGELKSQAAGLLPMKRDEFELRLLKAGSQANRDQPADCRIERAEYRAAFEANQLIAGRAEASVHGTAAQPTWLNLEESNLAIASANWDDSPDRPALVGLDSLGRTSLRVEQSSQLQLEWSARGRPVDRGGWQFDLKLLPAIRSELYIDLPAGYTMTADHGLLVRAHGSSDSADGPAAAADSDSSTVTWHLQLGGRHQSSISVYPPAAGRNNSVLLASEAATYRFAPGSLDADISLSLNVHEQPLRQIALRVEPRLDILSVRHANERLEWQEGAPDEAGVRRLILELPEPLQPGSHALQIAATAAWPLDRQLAIPRIHVEDAVWQNGSATLVSNSDVRISPRVLSGANQVKSVLAVGDAQSGSMQFDYYSEVAKVEVVAARPTAGLKVQSGLAVVIDASQATATLIADLTSDTGERFEFSASASRRWIIESVEAVPADLLEERRIEVESPDLQRLSVRLRHPLSANRPVRMVVRARRQQTGEGRQLAANFLHLLHFNDLREERRLVSVNSVDPALEPKLIGDLQLARRDPAQASPAELSFFESPPGPIFFETRASDVAGRLTLRRGEPRYAADIDHSVIASQKTLAHEVRISVRPESSSISNLLVRAAPQPPSEISWSIEGDASQIVVAKPIDIRAASDESTSEQLWRLQLQRPLSGAIAVVGRWTQPLESPSPQSLFSLPEATAQTGSIQVASSVGTSLQLQPSSLVALPLPPVAPSEINPVFARFGYDPGRHGKLAVGDDHGRTAALSLFVLKQEVRSTFSSDGSASHVAVFELENLGADRFSATLPEIASLERITVDGSPVSIASQARNGQTLSIPLPATRKAPVVEIHYSSRGAGQRWWMTSQFAAPLPSTSSPALARRWVVHLAPTIRCWAAHEEPIQTAGEPTAGPFDLFSAAAWRDLLTTLVPGLTQRRNSKVHVGSLGTGWQTHVLSLPDEDDAVIAVYRPASVHVLGICVALTIFALVGAFASSSRSRLAFLCLAGMCAFTLWFAPVAMTPTAWWAFAGLSAAAIWMGMKNPGERAILGSRKPQPPGTAPELAKGVAVLLIACISAVASQKLQAAEDPRDNQQQMHRVVIPVDENREPTSDYVYLTEDFYEALHRPAEAAGAMISHLFRSARYDITVTENESTLLPQGCEYATVYELETYVDDASITFPLGRGDVHLLESGSSLDGRPLTLAWNNSRDALTLQVPQSGRHRLELRFAVAFRRQEELYVADLKVPPVAQSRARVEYPADRGTCAFATPFGASDAAGEAGIVAAQLGPVTQLRIEYQPHRKSQEQLARVSVDQLIWWKVRPGSVLADARFEFISPDGELRELILRTDPQVKLLPLDSDAGIARQWVEEGPTNTIHLELSPPYPSEASLHATFLHVGATGSGSVLPPLIDAIADTKVRNWHAVSAIPGWQVDAPDAGLFPVNEFARAWGEAMESPRLAWDRAKFKASPALSVQPSEQRSQATQRIDYSIGRTTSAMHYEADIQPGLADFHFAISVPTAVRVRKVSAEGNDGPIEFQSWRSEDGVVTVALADAATGKVRLKLEGDFGTSQQRNLQTPFAELLDVDSIDYSIRIFRRRDAKLQIVENTGFSPSDSGVDGDYVVGLGRLVGDYVANAGQDKRNVRLSVTANTPELGGRMVTVVRSEQDHWHAELHCDLLVRNGMVDTLSFEVPEQWAGPFEIQPAVEYSLLTVPGQSRKHLLIRPQRAIDERIELVVRAPLAAVATETLRCPDVELLEAPAVARFLALPGGNLTKLAWETSGLQSAMADNLSWPGKISSERFEFFQVVSNRFEAIARRATDTQSRPAVRLADIEVSWQPDRSYFGTVNYDLHPSGLAECVLEIPQNCQLVAVTLDSGMANVNRISDRAVRIGLGRRQLASRLTLTFRGRSPLGENRQFNQLTFFVPSLEGMPVERTLWTIHAPPLAGSAYLNAALQVPAAVQNLERLRSCLAALESGPDSLQAEILAADVRNWSIEWNRRFDEVASRLESLQPSNTPDSEDLREQLRSLRGKRAAMIAKSGAALPLNDSSASVHPVVDDGASLRLMADGNLASAKVNYRRPAGRSSDRGLLFAASALLMLLGIGLFSRRKSAAQWLKTNSWLLLALLGVLIWLTLPLGIFGWFIVASAAVLAHWSRPWRNTLTT